MNDETEVASVTARYPPADITPAEFERFVAELFGSVATEVEDLDGPRAGHDQGVDGSYVFDATVRFTVAGLQMLVVVEAKRHGRSVERSYVQILHDKLRSVGAHKAVLVSTASFQRGALDYAGVHGIALVTVTEGRFLFHTRSREDGGQAPTREQAAGALRGIHVRGARLPPHRRSDRDPRARWVPMRSPRRSWASIPGGRRRRPCAERPRAC